MKATRLQADVYAAIFPDPLLVYSRTEFSELNRGKCDDLHYVAVSDAKGRIRFGLTLGLKDGELPVFQSEGETEPYASFSIADGHIMQIVTFAAVEFTELGAAVDQQRIGKYCGIHICLKSRSFHRILITVINRRGVR